MDIRMYTWLAGGLSWSYVMSGLAQAFEKLGHNNHFVSTNGLVGNNSYFTEQKMIESALALQAFGPGKKQVSVDLCYTVPNNFPARFLANSKNKCVIYNYETWPTWPKSWTKFYSIPDFYFPSSNFSAEIFLLNKVPAEKTFVIPHGVDVKMFNPDIPPVRLKTKKKFKFVTVVAPHYRKNIGALLNAYCRAFSPKDDVCLVLKTKVYKHSDGIHDAKTNVKGRKQFEIVLGDIFKELHKKYGNKIPEIELLTGFVDNVASIYNSCDCHVTTTGSEGWGLPMLESMACGLINIAPRYSGQMHFMHDNNSLLIDTGIRNAIASEQYWQFDPNAKIGEPSVNHTAELMRKVYENRDKLREKFLPEMKKTVENFSWTNAAQLIIDVVEGKVSPYEKGTYKLQG